MDLAATKTLWLLAWFVLLFLAERLWTASRAPMDRMRLAKNIGFWAPAFIVSPLFVIPLAVWADDALLWTRPQMLTGFMGVAVSLVVLDLWTYGVHRAYHEVPAMWRLHAPHHLDERLDTTSALRFHVGEIALSAVLRLIPIFAFSIPLAHVVIFETLLSASSYFHHSNTKLPPRLERILSKVIVTPAIHWVHHHADHGDTNSNYAAVFSGWDRWFGTRSATIRTPEMKIGVEGVEDKTLLGLFLSPFARSGR